MPYIDMNPPWVYMCAPSWSPLPPPFPSHPSGSSQCTSPEHSASCIEPGLAICFTYDNIHVSVIFSHIIPPSPSPTEFKMAKILLPTLPRAPFPTQSPSLQVLLFPCWYPYLTMPHLVSLLWQRHHSTSSSSLRMCQLHPQHFWNWK